MCPIASPSARKVWIEIIQMSLPALFPASPSARKVWIEIYDIIHRRLIWKVAFRKEGVD